MQRHGMLWYMEAGEMAPRWLGMCWHDPWRNAYALTVVPFNIPARIVHLLWLWARLPMRDSAREDERRKRLRYDSDSIAFKAAGYASQAAGGEGRPSSIDPGGVWRASIGRAIRESVQSKD